MVILAVKGNILGVRKHSARGNITPEEK